MNYSYNFYFTLFHFLILGVIFFIFSIFGSILLNMLSRKLHFLWFTPLLMASLLMLSIWHLTNSEFTGIVMFLFASFQLSVGSLRNVISTENLPDVVVVLLTFFHWIGDLVISISFDLLIYSRKMIGFVYLGLSILSLLIYFIIFKFIYSEKYSVSFLKREVEAVKGLNNEEEKSLKRSMDEWKNWVVERKRCLL